MKVVNEKDHYGIICNIVQDYLEELLGSSKGFDFEDLVEVSYNDIQEVLKTMQKIEENPNYRYDGCIKYYFVYFKIIFMSVEFLNTLLYLNDF